MLTGDKGETAHNIAISCGLIDSEQHEVVKVSGSNKDEIFMKLNDIQSKLGSSDFLTSRPSSTKVTTERDTDDKSDENKEYALLLDGTSLPAIFNDVVMQSVLSQVLNSIASVVVYRCSPDEKAQMI
jgi:magnesium-transporting ATPase (P-type)